MGKLNNNTYILSKIKFKQLCMILILYMNTV